MSSYMIKMIILTIMVFGLLALDLTYLNKAEKNTDMDSVKNKYVPLFLGVLTFLAILVYMCCLYKINVFNPIVFRK